MKIALKLDMLKSEKSGELEIFGFGISSFKYLLLSDLKSTKYAKQTEIRLLENNIGNLDGMRQNEGTTRNVFILSESSSCNVFYKQIIQTWDFVKAWRHRTMAEYYKGA